MFGKSKTRTVTETGGTDETVVDDRLRPDRLRGGLRRGA